MITSNCCYQHKYHHEHIHSIVIVIIIILLFIIAYFVINSMHTDPNSFPSQMYGSDSMKFDTNNPDDVQKLHDTIIENGCVALLSASYHPDDTDHKLICNSSYGWGTIRKTYGFNQIPILYCGTGCPTIRAYWNQPDMSKNDREIVDIYWEFTYDNMTSLESSDEQFQEYDEMYDQSRTDYGNEMPKEIEFEPQGCLATLFPGQSLKDYIKILYISSHTFHEITSPENMDRYIETFKNMLPNLQYVIFKELMYDQRAICSYKRKSTSLLRLFLCGSQDKPIYYYCVNEPN